MDPITLIVTALAAGATLGISDMASSAIKDAYAGLKALVRKRLGGRPEADLVLAKHEQAPEAWATSRPAPEAARHRGQKSAGVPAPWRVAISCR